MTRKYFHALHYYKCLKRFLYKNSTICKGQESKITPWLTVI